MRRRPAITLEMYLGKRAWYVGAIQAVILVAGIAVFGLVFAGLAYGVGL